MGPGLEGDDDRECEACAEPFHVSRHCSITYTTNPIG